MRENPAIKSALCDYLETDSTIKFVSAEDTICLTNGNNFYKFEYCNGGPLSYCYRLAFYKLSVSYSGNGWAIGYYISYEESYGSFEISSNIQHDDPDTYAYQYYYSDSDDIRSELADELMASDSENSPNDSYVKISKGVGLTEFKVNGKIYRRIR